MSAKHKGASRVRGPDVDAGLHAETGAGPVDVGLALSDTAAGMVVDAPGLGIVRVAFEVGEEGTIKRTALSRKTTASDLFVAPIVVLEAQVAAALADARALNGKLANADARADTLEEALRNTSEKLAAELQRATALETALATEKATLAERQAELEEEQALRDEMVRDLAFIQSQVSALSSTKGALVNRIDQMSKRETKRQKSTADFSDLLRDAEVVAADKQMTARRFQAHAGKLEEQIVELRQRNEALEARLAAAEEAHEQLVQVNATGSRSTSSFFRSRSARCSAVRLRGRALRLRLRLRLRLSPCWTASCCLKRGLSLLRSRRVGPLTPTLSPLLRAREFSERSTAWSLDSGHSWCSRSW